MKTASVRDLRNHYTDVFRWIDAGEDVLITKRGRVVARLSPESEDVPEKVDWKNSPEVTRDGSKDVRLTAEQSSSILREASGRW